MDEDKKAKIISHIDSIIAYAKQPGNEWLLEALHERLLKSSLHSMEKYLGLDYIIDGKTVQLDCSFVKDEDLRMRLESDWREMLRYRCGTRNHCIDYVRYCVHAHFQCEGLVNYFFSIYMGNSFKLDWFNECIERQNKINEDNKILYSVKAISVDSTKCIDEIIINISYSTKLYVIIYCFREILNISDNDCKSLSIGLNDIRKVRNNSSHRAANTKDVGHNSDFDRVYHTLSNLYQWTKELTLIYLED